VVNITLNIKCGPALILTKDQLSIGGIDNYCSTVLLRECVAKSHSYKMLNVEFSFKIHANGSD